MITDLVLTAAEAESNLLWAECQASRRLETRANIFLRSFQARAGKIGLTRSGEEQWQSLGVLLRLSGANFQPQTFPRLFFRSYDIDSHGNVSHLYSLPCETVKVRIPSTMPLLSATTN